MVRVLSAARTWLFVLASAVTPVAYADDAETYLKAILNDPATPVAGDPESNLTIVTFFDYNCQFCKKAEAALDPGLT